MGIINTMSDENNNTATATATETDAPATAPAETPKKAKPAIEIPNLSEIERLEVREKIDAIVAKAKGESENPLKLPMLLDNVGSQYSGDEKLPERVKMIAVLIDAQPSELMFHRCGPSALGQALSNYGIGENPEADLNVRKTVEESASEQALATFGQVTASKAVKKLAESAEDVATIQSASHAAHHAGLKVLSQISLDKTTGKPVVFPRNAADFVSVLIAASSGSLDWFPCSDPFITEATGMSKATIKRGREALLEWQDKTGRGVVSMRQGSGGEKTLYRLELLRATTAIMQNLLGSKYSSPDALLVVAGLAGKMLEGETASIKGVGDAELAAAKEITESIRGAVSNLPSPEVKRSAASEGSSKTFITKSFEKVREQIGDLLDKATAAGLDNIVETLNAQAIRAREAEALTDADKQKAELEGIQNTVNAAGITYKEATQSAAEKAEEKAEAEREATGAVSVDTRLEVARAYVSAVSPEAYQVERQAAYEEALDAVAKVYAFDAMTEKPDEAIQKSYTTFCTDVEVLASTI